MSGIVTIGVGHSCGQRPRRADFGELYVSFWQMDGFSLRTAQEMGLKDAPVKERPPQRKRGGHDGR